ncbi:MAG: tetratricopeptide repeat protein [Saprospiraceae bacterium]|nr:tetratricopeptide repeat protein [Saprospiraceae bacterium]
MKNWIAGLFLLVVLSPGFTQTPLHVFRRIKLETVTGSKEVDKMYNQTLKNSLDYKNAQTDSARLRGVIDAHREELLLAGNRPRMEENIRMQLEKSTEEYRFAQQYLENYRSNAWLLAKAFDELPAQSKRTKNARRLFTQGKLEEAVQSIPVTELEKETASIVDAAPDDPRRALLAREWLLLANLTGAAYEYSRTNEISVTHYFKRAIECDPQTGIMMEYAGFFMDHNEYIEAIEWFGACAESSWAQRDTGLWLMAQTNLGSCYHLYGDAAHSLAAYQKALEVCRPLAKSNPERYQYALAELLNNTGALYMTNEDYVRSEACFVEALAIYRRPSQVYPESYYSNLASVTYNLGVLYVDTNQKFDKAEELLVESSNRWRDLAEVHPLSYEDYLADALLKLGSIYSEKSDFRRAEKSFIEARTIYGKLAVLDPEEYEDNWAQTLGYLGEMYNNKKDLKKSQESYTLCLGVYERLAEQDSTYRGDLATALNNYGVLLEYMHDMKGAETLFYRTLAIRQQLEKEEPGQHTSALASVYNNLGVLYAMQGQFDKAEQYYKNTLELFLQLAKDQPQVYENDVARSENNLGLFYVDQNKLPEAIEMLERARDTRVRQHKEFPEIYNLDLAYALNNLGYAYLKNGQLEQVPECLSRSQELLPDNSWVYRNWGAYYAQKKDYAKAIEYLRKAADMGFDEPHWFDMEKSLDPLRSDPAFPGIVEKVKRNTRG